MSAAPLRTPEQAAVADAATQIDSSTVKTEPSASSAEPNQTEMTEAQATEEMRRVYDQLTGAGQATQNSTDGDGNPNEGTTQPANTDGDSSVTGNAGEQTQTDSFEAEPERIEKARQALKRWQWPDDLLAQLPENVILERGEAAAESQASFDREITEKKKLERTVEEVLAERERKRSLSEGNQDGEPTSTGNQDGQSTTDSASLADSILADAGELVNDTEMGPVLKSLGNAVRGLEERISGLNNENKTLRTQVQGRQDAMQIESARRELAVEYPALADQEQYQPVEALVFKLSQLPGYLDASGNADVKRLMRDAASTVFGVPDAKKNNGTHQSYQRQIDGQPDGHLGGGQVVQGMTKDDQLLAAFNMTFKEGKDPDSVRHALRRGDPN